MNPTSLCCRAPHRPVLRAKGSPKFPAIFARSRNDNNHVPGAKSRLAETTVARLQSGTECTADLPVMSSEEEKPSSASPETFAKKVRIFEYFAPASGRRSPRLNTKSGLDPVETTAADRKRSSPDHPTASQSPSKRSRLVAPSRSGSAPGAKSNPSRYAHLPYLRDTLEDDLICVFVGLNPGIATSKAGHAYAHPSNHFWTLLHSSGCTDRKCRPEEDGDLPRLYAMGNTNIVGRPTKDQSELTRQEMVDGTPVLDEKFRKCKPEAVCIVGKGIWEAIWKYRHGKNITKEQFRYGWQDRSENMGKGGSGELDFKGVPWKGSHVFVACSTSGLAASLSPTEKEEIWKPLGEWVKQRRKERAAAKEHEVVVQEQSS